MAPQRLQVLLCSWAQRNEVWWHFVSRVTSITEAGAVPQQCLIWRCHGSAFSPASIHKLALPTTTFPASAALVVTWLASSERWSSQPLPSQQNELPFKAGFSSRLLIPLKCLTLTLATETWSSGGSPTTGRNYQLHWRWQSSLRFLFLLSRCVSTTFPHTKVLSIMCSNNLQYFIIPYSNSVPPSRYSCTLVTKIRISEHSVQYTQLQRSKWW